MLTRREIEERLQHDGWLEAREHAALLAAKALADWLYWMTRSCDPRGEESACPFAASNSGGLFCGAVNGDLDRLHEAPCWVAQEGAVTWLEGHGVE